MTDFSKSNNLLLIAGDILEVYFSFENIDVSSIEEVIFICAEKQIEATLEYSSTEQAYALRLESEDTADIEPGIASYDLTIKFADGNYFTAVYENALNVLPKNNRLSKE